MKQIIILFVLFSVVNSYSQTKDYPFVPVTFNKVTLSDNFWKPKLQVNRDVTIPFCIAKCEETGRVKNFSIAAKLEPGAFCTNYAFDDSDVYKAIEAASYSLQLFPDKKLEHHLDSLIAIVAKAQEPDGYLYTARTIDPKGGTQLGRMGTERWVKEREHSHELYNAGHLYEAAVAHYLATGKRNLLDIAIKNANLIDQVFGPDKMHTIPGHQVIEIGLAKLYRITKDDRYLKLAKFFLDERGKFNYAGKLSTDGFQNGEYWQDHKPVIDQREAVGHAVRAGYMYAGMADVAALTGNQQYLTAIDSLWQSVASKKMYLTGGVGAAGDGERFGKNYELPNATAYAETCAAVAQVYWNHRMFLLHGEAKYIDVLEKILYNGFISGVALDGKSFFYSNAMEINNVEGSVEAERKRSGWFSCACCPPNIARLMASVPGYIYAQRDKEIFINLFISSKTQFEFDKQKISVTLNSNYPWDGKIVVSVDPSAKSKFTVSVRIPGWAMNHAMPTGLYSFAETNTESPSVSINGVNQKLEVRNGYVSFTREWKKGDKLELNLPMSARRVVANNQVMDDRGKVAVQRGPIVYCAEGKDNQGATSNLILPDQANLVYEFKTDFLNGLGVITSSAKAIKIESSQTDIETKSQALTLIPYFSWANRGEGEMEIWFPKRITGINIKSK
ncbi:MAG TPA: six-hairpin glycosidase [Cytophagales bacterium]|jgi:uncharacterized protein|nr:six-hairpin glycosidase [Cytophagales bacterium]